MSSRLPKKEESNQRSKLYTTIIEKLASQSCFEPPRRTWVVDDEHGDWGRGHTSFGAGHRRTGTTTAISRGTRTALPLEQQQQLLLLLLSPEDYLRPHGHVSADGARAGGGALAFHHD